LTYAGAIRYLVDVEDHCHEQRWRQRRQERLQRDRATRLNRVGTEQHYRSKADGRGDLTEAAIDELERRHRVGDADKEAQRCNYEQCRRAAQQHQKQPKSDGYGIAADREHRHLSDGD